MKEGKRDEAEAVKASLRDLGDRIRRWVSAEAKRLEAERDDLLFYIPNLPHRKTTPPGAGRKLSDRQNTGRAEDV